MLRIIVTPAGDGMQQLSVGFIPTFSLILLDGNSQSGETL